ncbi:MAG: guanylate kinase [Agathobacter sp.]
MGKIFCLMGKSSTGKDSIYHELFSSNKLNIKKVIPYTTRPIREGEADGREYFFCSKETAEQLEQEKKIIELRVYHTVYGDWKYFTADDGQINLSENNYLLIGTLEAYLKIRDYFGEDAVVPIYVEVEDGERLIRAIERERTQSVPKYEEMCRRFLADAADFSEENLQKAGIEKRFVNEHLDKTIEEITEFIEQRI